MKINRENFLSILYSTSAGLSSREVVEQSASYVFKDGKIISFNDETACVGKSPLDIEGAVRADTLKNILEKLKEEELEVEQTDSELILKGKGRRACITMQKEITLPIEYLEKPKHWQSLPENFDDAVQFVQECASKDEAKFAATCIHIHPEWIEACDNNQLARWYTKVGLDHAILIRQLALKHVLKLDVIEYCEGEKWVHFRNAERTVLSCRKYIDDYHDYSGVLDQKGERVTLPPSLGEAAARAGVFSVDNTDNDEVKIDLMKGKIRISGQGHYGRYSETRKIKYYRGPDISFFITPTMLEKVLVQGNECEVNDRIIKIDNKKSVFVASVKSTDEKEETAPTNGKAKKKKKKEKA